MYNIPNIINLFYTFLTGAILIIIINYNSNEYDD